MNRCLVSVVLAVYNGEKYLEFAIESVLNQVHPFIELILINDGSTDRTEKIAQKFGNKLIYVCQENRGQPYSMNLGIRIAKGSYLAFIDADDLYLKDKTTLQLNALEKNPQLDMVFGAVQQFFSPELPIESTKKWKCPQEITPAYLPLTGLFRRKCFDEIGLFNESQPIGLFIEWYMRAQEKGLKAEIFPMLCARRRIHDSNMGIQHQKSKLEYIRILKQALNRRRGYT